MTPASRENDDNRKMTIINDKNFPGLNAALDEQWVLNLLRRDMRVAGSLEISKVAVKANHYRPGESCIVVYNVELRDTGTGRARQEILSARVLGVGEEPILPSQDTIERFSALPNQGLRTAAIYSPEERTVLYAAPLDPALPWLLDAFEPETIKTQLNRILPSETQRVSTKLVSYWPQARSVIRLDLFGTPGGCFD